MASPATNLRSLTRSSRVAQQEVAIVVDVAGESIEIESAGVRSRARRAASCLLAPERGDEVLVAIVEGRPAYVLAILEREGSLPSRVELEGDASITTPRGRLSISSGEGIDIVAEKDANVVSNELRVRAVTGHFVVDAIELFSGALSAHVERARSVVKTLDTVAERVVERVQRAYRFVEEVEHVRAERIDYQASKELTIRAENAVIMADELVKVDGSQIHVG
jgi:hypothetical protein